MLLFGKTRREDLVYKVAWFIRFREGLEREEARRHWREQHGPLGAKVPRIERYVQNHATLALGAVGLSDEGLAFDGYSCCWYVDSDAFHASLKTLEWAALGPDGEEFLDTDWFWVSAALDERMIIAGPTGPFKTVWIVRFKDEIRRDSERTREAHEYWTRTHGGAFGRAVPGIGRYVQNHVVAAVGPEGEMSGTPLFDGFSECWFEDRAAFDEAMASPEWLAMNADAENLFDIPFSLDGMSAVVEEHVAKGEPELANI